MEQVGSELSGKIEIERRGYVTVSEKAFVQAATQGNDTQARLFSIVSKVAAETGKASTDILEDLGSGEPPEYLGPYMDKLVLCMNDMQEVQNKVSVMAATALLMSRVDASITVEEVMSIHPDIIDGLYTLYQDEESKTLTRLEQQIVKEEENTGEDAEGKPLAAS